MQRGVDTAAELSDVVAQKLNAAADPRAKQLRKRKFALWLTLFFTGSCLFLIFVTWLLATWNTPAWALFIPAPIAVGAGFLATLAFLRYRWLRREPLPPQRSRATRRLPPFGSAARQPMAALAASSPFGIATPDGSGSVAWAGPFKGFFIWVAAQQAGFYRELTAALHHVTDSGHAALFMIALSFAYGVFHAVGPGHGKAVISSYLLASGDSLKRGVAISFASAFVQAATAIVVVSMVLAALKLAIIVLLLGAFVVRPRETFGLFALLASWAALKAWPAAGFSLLGVIGVVALYRAASRSTDTTI